MHFIERHQAKISSLVRGFLTKKWFVEYLKSILLIQRKVRGFLCRQQLKRQLQNKAILFKYQVRSLMILLILLGQKICFNRSRKENAIMIIQRYFKRYLIRRHKIQPNCSTTHIDSRPKHCQINILELRHAFLTLKWKRLFQSYSRMKFQRQRSESRKIIKILIGDKNHCKYKDKKIRAAIGLQQLIRGHLLKKKKMLKIEFELKQKFSSALIIQHRWRQHRVWVKIKEAVNASEKHFKSQRINEINLVRKLEQHWQLHKLRCEANVILREKVLQVGKLMKLKCAINIQKTWRRNRSCLYMRELRDYNKKMFLISLHDHTLHIIAQQAQNKSILILQRALQKYIFSKPKKQLDVDSVRKVQKWYRINRSRKRKLKMNEASLKIQHAYRSYQFWTVIRNHIREELSGDNMKDRIRIHQMVDDSKKQRLQKILHKRDHSSAKLIQKASRKFIQSKHEIEKKISLAKEKEEEKRKEEERLRNFLSRKKIRKKNFIQLLRQKSIGKVERIVTSFHYPTKHDYHDFKIIKNSSKTKKKITVETLKQYDWFDSRLSKAMISYKLEPFEIFQFYSIFQSLEHEEGSNRIDILDFFDLFNDQKSMYGVWLLDAIETDSFSSLKFSEFVHIVAFASFMGKESVYCFLFSSIDVERNANLSDVQWRKFVEGMVKHEDVQYGTRSAIKAFSSYAKKMTIDEREGPKLPFDGFRQVGVLQFRSAIVRNIFMLHFSNLLNEVSLC